jgi:GNAT superfamily N-acetyltransferase
MRTMMNVIDFNQTHIKAAKQIAKDNYNMERKLVTILPEVDELPDLLHFAENGLGVVAMEGDRMLGFLCTYLPREDAFGTTKVKGTFSPIHAHGVSVQVTGTQRDQIYSRMYQAAAQKWIKEGIRSHAIGFLTYDKDALNSFFYNGFGLRCIDAIRSLEDIPARKTVQLPGSSKLDYVELLRDEWVLLLEQHNALIRHLGNSPTFMHFELMDEEALYHHTSVDVRYFAAKTEGNYIAYIKLAEEGENFASEQDSMVNICGAYCEPEYRGLGIYHNLLCHMMDTLKKEGYQLLGVDCESFNPTARGFWLKYFTEYTHSVVRRIDEKAVDAAIKTEIDR